MAAQAVQQWRKAQQEEASLKALMKGDTLPTYGQLEELLKTLRIACEETLFSDFEYATKEGVGQRLWDVHTMINSRYRKLVDRYRKGDQRKLLTERRKTEKHYVDFIKTSQFFYKGFIQRLASHFAGMKGLRRIAHRLSLSTLTVDQRVVVSPAVERMIEQACHATLLRLGDLSRYRNHIRTKDRSWEPALGYYSLANDLCPDIGSAHNQMAVIALADGSHLNAVYHLYRAITVHQPHSLAKNNLEIEFKKIITAWEKKVPLGKTDSLSTLTWWFVLLHAKFYDGIEFSTRQELEKEILSRLALLLKEKSFGEILEKLVIVNIAAQSFAGERITEQNTQASQEIRAAYFFCLSFNVRMLSVFLQVLLPELEDQATGEELPNGSDGSRSDMTRDKISVVTRRVLPALRQYSTWLSTAAEILVSEYAMRLMDGHIREMWNLYAAVLTRLANFFPVENLVTVEYLLEEDETTVGFKPLRDPKLLVGCDLYTDNDRKLKPRITDPGVERHHPNIEMQSRVRDILLIGLSLLGEKKIPISLIDVEGRPAFIFNEEQMILPSTPNPPSSTHPTSTHTSNNFSPRDLVGQNDDALSSEVVTASSSQQSMDAGMDTDMLRMVDDLVEPPSFNGRNTSNETSYGMHSLTANEIFAPIGTPKMLPSLPGLYNSAFTPQPNELQPTSPLRPMTARQLSPLSLATKEDQLVAAEGLDKRTGYIGSKNGSWGRKSSSVLPGSSASRNDRWERQSPASPDEMSGFSGSRNGSWGGQSSRPLSNSVSQPVNHLLQQSLTQQYMPMSSAAFSDSSSLYANTPKAHNRNGDGALANSLFAAINGNNSTTYTGTSDFDRTTMLQSSIWNGSQRGFERYAQTPPGGQGG